MCVQPQTVYNNNITVYVRTVNPATVVKYRFPPEVIEKLLRMEWWDWEDERIMSMAQYSSAEEVVAAWEAGILQAVVYCLPMRKLQGNHYEYIDLMPFST